MSNFENNNLRIININFKYLMIDIILYMLKYYDKYGSSSIKFYIFVKIMHFSFECMIMCMINNFSKIYMISIS